MAEVGRRFFTLAAPSSLWYKVEVLESRHVPLSWRTHLPVYGLPVEEKHLRQGLKSFVAFELIAKGRAEILSTNGSPICT